MASSNARSETTASHASYCARSEVTGYVFHRHRSPLDFERNL